MTADLFTDRVLEILSASSTPVSPDLAKSLEAAVAFLLDACAEDGHWEDWDLGGQGPADAWMTAYVSLALAAAAAVLAPGGARTGQAWTAARRGLEWLEQWRARHGQRWGYNANFPPDVDSTSLALALQQALGIEPRVQDVFFLLQCWNPRGGGFGYYRGDGAAGITRPEATGLVYRGLPPAARARLHPLIAGWLRDELDANGAWPCAWWTRRHFGAWHAWDVLGPPAPVPHVEAGGQDAVATAFDLACVIGRSTLCERPGLAEALSAELIAHQRADGGWDGGPTMNAFPIDDNDPDPEVRVITDTGIATTATAVRALSTVLRRPATA